MGTDKVLSRKRDFYETARRDLADAVAQRFPKLQKCAIERVRNGTTYRIWGFVEHHPSAADPTRIGIRTAKRGTIMWADYEDLII